MLQKIFKKRKPRTLIIGIHGLSNKPPVRILKRWWRLSIEEGLRGIGSKSTKFDFRMVYWADILYKKPLDPKVKEQEDSLYIDEPYIPSHKLRQDNNRTLWQYVKNIGQYVKDVIYFSKYGLNTFRKPFDYIVKRDFRDLDVYYNELLPKSELMDSESAKFQIRRRLSVFLQKHRKKNILIVAHSMGSIIAYDVLYQLQKEVDISVLLTLGSPLGLSLVRKNIINDHHIEDAQDNALFTPDNLSAWHNFSDEDDALAAFNPLRATYLPNKSGVAPVEKLVVNDYKMYKTENAHKSFGYLRTVEVAQVISDFLSSGRSSLFIKGKQLWFSAKFRERINLVL